MEEKLLDWDKRPFVTDNDMTSYMAREGKTASQYGKKVLAVPIANVDYKTRFNKSASLRKMQPPPSCGRIFLGYLVVRKLNTPEEYETWMPDHVFSELYRPLDNSIQQDSQLDNQVSTEIVGYTGKRTGSVVSLREATKDDISDVLHLYAQPDLDNGKVLPLTEAFDRFEHIMSYRDYKIYIALCSKGKIIGTFALLIMDNLAHLGSPSAIIEDVAVDPEWQSRGIGKLMMNYALQKSEEKGCYKMVLSSNLKRDQAHAFYESLGFERHGYSYRINVK